MFRKSAQKKWTFLKKDEDALKQYITAKMATEPSMTPDVTVVATPIDESTGEYAAMLCFIDEGERCVVVTMAKEDFSRFAENVRATEAAISGRSA